MPLFRVNVRSKELAGEGASADPSQEERHSQAAHSSPAESPSRPRAAGDTGRGAAPATQGRAGLAALAAGTLCGLALVAGVSVVLMRRGANPDSAGGPSAAPVVSGPESDLPTGGEAASWNDTRTGPSSINPEFNLEESIAYVNNISIAMRDLDRAVRVARVLGDLSGEPVPANDSPEFRAYQIRMLKRLVDLELMAQGVRTAGLMIPGGDTQAAVDAYLAETGTTADELAERMAAHNVTPAELDRWFRDGRTANFLVTQSLTVGKETMDRDQVTNEWLTEQWESQAIVINFYEPEE